MLRIFVFLVGISVLWSHQAQAQFSDCNNKTYVHRDIVILGFPCPANFNGKDVQTQQGVNKIIKAIDLLAEQSPRSFSVIKKLKAAGPVMIVYDPSFPPPGAHVATQQIALFLPTFVEKIDQTDTGKKFTVIVGRNGIKWPLKELTAVLVHELMGHGKQHLENRINEMRVLDVECEAWLREEMAYQDLKLDKHSPHLIDFRQQLESLHCSDFIRYMRKRVPKQAGIWDAKDPNVPKLLKIFEGYIKVQREMGMIASAKTATENQLKEAVKRASGRGDAQEHYDIGTMYLSSVGQQPDAKNAAIWFEKAAKRGHHLAQFSLGQLYETGNGVKKNPAFAAKLYAMAAKKGKPEALYALGVLFEKGMGVDKSLRKAQALYKRARMGTDPRPLVVFANMHNDGTGFSIDHRKAYELFLKAARLGSREAQYEIALLLESGRGVAKNEKLAQDWIYKSADQGYAPARRKLAE